MEPFSDRDMEVPLLLRVLTSCLGRLRNTPGDVAFRLGLLAVLLRAGVDNFLEIVSRFYEVVIFTASLQSVSGGEPCISSFFRLLKKRAKKPGREA